MAYYWKAPWPTNAKGLHLFVGNVETNENYDLQTGLTQVRKNVLSDFNNDGKSEVMLFSGGYDAPPFPGDSLAFFDVLSKKYKYLSEDIGYFHGGATGDINNDGFEDIVAYSGGSVVIPVHPVFYQNDGSGNFELKNDIFLNFTDADNYYTVELFDIDNDGYLDLFLGSTGVLLVIKNENGTFDRLKGINIQSDSNLEVMDIDFFDFDNDDIKEVLVMNNISGYQGHSLNLYKFSFQSNSQITSSYFDETKFEGNNSWIKWVHIFDYDKDGDLDIVGMVCLEILMEIKFIGKMKVENLKELLQINMKKFFSFLLIVVLIACSKDPVIYTLTATANPAEGGSVSPSSQQYDSGDVATVRATPSAEYVFQSWSGSASGSS